MDMLKDFRKFASHGHGLSNDYIDRHFSNMTQYVIEERDRPFRAIDVFTRLMADRIIFLGMPIDDYVANIIVAQLLFLESNDREKDITMYINTPGGSIYAGLGIYDTMRYVNPNVNTICTGLAASMGAILLCAGQKGNRSMLPHARVMIHQPIGGVQGQASDIEITAKEIQYLKKEICNIIVEHTGQNYKKVWKDSDRDFWMSSEEALNYGIIDKILLKKS